MLYIWIFSKKFNLTQAICVSHKMYKIIGTPNLHVFFFSFSACPVISNFVIFYSIKVAKHVCNQCRHLVQEIGS